MSMLPSIAVVSIIDSSRWSKNILIQDLPEIQYIDTIDMALSIVDDSIIVSRRWSENILSQAFPDIQ